MAEHARYLVRRAVRDGTLVRPDTCERCGAECKPVRRPDLTRQQIHAHHEDYTKPLDVIWLCFRCHKFIHPGYVARRKDAVVTAESGSDTITIPRPKPDEAVIAVCDENGATGWVTGTKELILDGSLRPQLLAVLADGQQRLYEQQAEGAA